MKKNNNKSKKKVKNQNKKKIRNKKEHKNNRSSVPEIWSEYL